MRIELDNGKYTYCINDDGSDHKALRYGEEWRNLTGDTLIYHMGQRIAELDKRDSEMLKRVSVAEAQLLGKLIRRESSSLGQKLLEKHNLEQQAKGIEESLNYVMESKSKIVTVSSLLLYAEDLRKQASELDKAK